MRIGEATKYLCVRKTWGTTANVEAKVEGELSFSARLYILQ